MVLRCKTLIFHIFQKMKTEKNLKKNSKKILKNISLTINKQKNLYIEL